MTYVTLKVILYCKSSDMIFARATLCLHARYWLSLRLACPSVCHKPEL